MSQTSERKGDWIQTYTGRAFWPLVPSEDAISLADIVHALSMQCRFGGHCIRFYSVAEHSLWCSLTALWPADSYMFCKDVLAAVRKVKRHLSGLKKGQQDHTRLQLALAALMHDAAEAYLIDLPKPIKVSIPEYREFEKAVEDTIWKRLNLPLVPHDLIKRIDNQMLVTERQHLMAKPPMAWSVQADPFPLRGETLGVSPDDAKRAFHDLYAFLVDLLGADLRNETSQ